MTQHGDKVVRGKAAAPRGRPDPEGDVGPRVVLAVWRTNLGWQAGSVALNDEMEAHDVASLLLDLDARVFMVDTDPHRDEKAQRVPTIEEYGCGE